MKKFILLLLTLSTILTLFSSCENDDIPKSTTESISLSQSTSNTEQITTVEDNSENTYNDALTEYNKFLKGEINATDPSYEENRGVNIININDICSKNNEVTFTEYAFFDMNGDGILELHLRPTENSVCYSIFTYQNGQVILWYRTTHYCYPLNNGTIFYERLGGGPTHTNYRYIILDFYGNVLYELDFYQYDEVIEENIKYNAIYNFDGVDVTKETWEALTERFFAIKSDLIVWKNVGDFQNEDLNDSADNSAIITYVDFLPVSYIKDGVQLLTYESWEKTFNTTDNMRMTAGDIYQYISDAPNIDDLNKIDANAAYTPDSAQRENNDFIRYLDFVFSNGDWDFFPVKVKYEKYDLNNQPDNPEWNDYFKEQIERPTYANGVLQSDVLLTVPVVITEAWIFDWNGVETAIVTASNIIYTGDDEKEDEPNPPPDDYTSIYTISAVFMNGNEPNLMYNKWYMLSDVSYNSPGVFGLGQYISAVQNDKNGELILCPVFTWDVAGDTSGYTHLFRPVYLPCDIDGDGQIELMQYNEGFSTLYCNYDVFETVNGELVNIFSHRLG